jgi:hypothetical protein
MLVSTAMLTFIVIGLTAVFIQTQRAFKTAIKASTITDAGRTIMDMVSTDMRQMSDAQEIGFTNLYWSWSGNHIQVNQNGEDFRTNQLDEIYVLEHVNTTWTGIGYAVQNLAPPGTGPSFGTLYRYETNFNAPFFTSNFNFIGPFLTSIKEQNFTNQAYWHRVADGVVSLKMFAYDQNGNEPWIESTYYGDYDESAEISYPFTSNTLPNAVDVELAILEPDALAQARSLAQVPAALNSYMGSNALTKMEIFRRRVSIPVVAR